MPPVVSGYDMKTRRKTEANAAHEGIHETDTSEIEIGIRANEITESCLRLQKPRQGISQWR
jgi:hypothetical protein